jgi:DNA-binding Xre family transcriptional regulator
VQPAFFVYTLIISLLKVMSRLFITFFVIFFLDFLPLKSYYIYVAIHQTREESITNMIKFKFDVASALATAGVTAYTAQKSGVLSQDTWRKIKAGDTHISLEAINRICCILHMQPEHLIYYAPDQAEEEKILKNFQKKS